MPRSRRLLLWLMSILTLAGLLLAFNLLRKRPQENPRPAADPALAVFGESPEWSQLDAFQRTITRRDFEALLTTVFTTGDGWRALIEVDDREARIQTGLTGREAVFHLAFVGSGKASPVARYWRTAEDIPPALRENPLAGLHIAIDPGHIGGAWARTEERWLKAGTNPAVCEGDMTLQVAKLLKPRLESLGAKVSLLRETNEPLTRVRPDDLLAIAKSLSPGISGPPLQKLAARLFYRTAEIRARAQYVNQVLKPDLVICLHFNADAWGDPEKPTLVERSHLHLLVNGAYSDDELGLADQRFCMLHKLLQRTHREEVRIASSVADAMAFATGLPAFRYPPHADNVRPIANHPYLWARNLLANRLYQCPVIYTEPYVMNSVTDFARIQAGDYSGLRQVAGKPHPSIFREYADTVTQGLKTHYSSRPILR